MKKNILLILLACLPLSFVDAQPQSKAQIDEIVLEGRDLVGAGKYVEAADKFEKALSFYRKNPGRYQQKMINARLWIARCIRYNYQYQQSLDSFLAIAPLEPVMEHSMDRLGLNIGLGVCYYKLNQYQKAKNFLKKAEQIFSDNPPDDKYQPMTNAYKFLGHIYRGEAKADSAIHYYEKGLQYNIDYFDTKIHPDVGLDYIVLGTAYQASGRLSESIEHFEEGINIIKSASGPEHKSLMQGYAYLSVTYSMIGELYKAEAYFKQAEAITRKYYPPDHIYFAVLYSNGGDLYRKLEDFDTAFEMLKKAEIIYKKKLPEGHLKIGTNMLNMAILLSKSERHREALDYAGQAAQVMVQSNGAEFYELANAYNAEGMAYMGLKEYGKAFSAFDKSLKVAEQNFVRPKLNFASPNFNKAEILSEQKKYREAIDYFNIALEGLAFDENEPYPIHEVGWVNYLLEMLSSRASTYMELFQQSGEIRYLEKSLRDYQLGMGVFSDVFSYFREADIANLINQLYYFMEEAVAAHYKASVSSGNKVYLKQAYELLERSKSILLYKAALKNTAQTYAAVSGEMLDKETELKLDIAELAARVDEARQQGMSKEDTAFINLSAELAAEQEKLDIFLRELETEYPSYYRLKYNFQVIGVEHIQSKLQSDEAHIAYFMPEELHLAFVITKNDFRVVELSADYPITEWCQRLCHAIYDTPGDDDAYATYGYGLYQKLLQPLGELPLKCTIVPDGALYYLPFGVLLAAPPEDQKAYHKHEYLLKKHQFAYSFSATLTETMASQPLNNKGLLVVAPAFPADNESEFGNYRRDNLAPLMYNRKEGEAITAIMGGSLMDGNQASVNAFRERAAQYSLFHFATHAKAEDYNSDYSYLAFAGAQSDSDSGKIYLRDLYALQLPAEMVVLSACETGLGEFRQGEGVLSLARGFAYAGARSIITSLWAANDASTARLMERYYQHLKEGLPKDAALRRAKLDYLEAATEAEDAHPFKWGGFIAIGDMSPITSSDSRWWLWALAGVLVIGLLAYVRRKA